MPVSKYTKFAVMLFGLLGIIAFFMPLVHVKEGGFTGKASAFQIIKGLGEVQKAGSDIAREHDGDVREIGKGVEEGAGAIKAFVYAVFAPALVCLLLGVFGAIGRFGRGKAIFVMLLGLTGVAIWALLRAAGAELGKDLEGGDPLGSGITMLGISYFGLLIAGLFGTIKPEPKAQAAAPVGFPPAGFPPPGAMPPGGMPPAGFPPPGGPGQIPPQG
jgi:hypothetical protein